MNSSVVLHGEEMDFLSAVYGVSRVSWKLLFDFISQPGWLGELRAEQAARILQRTGEMLHRHFPGIPGTDGAARTPGWAEPARKEDPVLYSPGRHRVQHFLARVQPSPAAVAHSQPPRAAAAAALQAAAAHRCMGLRAAGHF